MWTRRAAVRLAPVLFVLAARYVSSAAEEKMRFVLVPERTELAPVKVSLARTTKQHCSRQESSL